MLFSVNNLGEVGQILLIAAQEWAGHWWVGGEKLYCASHVSLGFHYVLSLLLNKNNMTIVIILISIISKFGFVSVITQGVIFSPQFFSPSGVG